MKKQATTTVTWRFGFSEETSRLGGPSVIMTSFDSNGRETGEDEVLGMIRISSNHPGDIRDKSARVEIFADNPVVAQTASIIGSRDLHRALHIDHYVNNTAHIPLRCNESFLDGALRIAQELLNGLRAKMRPRHVAAPDWMIGNFSIHQHTYVYLPNSPIPGHDTGHGWYPIETLIKRQHGLD